MPVKRYFVVILYGDRLIGDVIKLNEYDARHRAREIARSFEYEGEAKDIEVLVLEEKERIVVRSRKKKIYRKEKKLYG